MYLGAGSFLIVVGIVLMVAPHDSTRTLPLDLLGAVLIATGIIGLLINVFRRMRRRRTRRHVQRRYPPVTACGAPAGRGRHNG